jgi:hypothetical protein
MDTLFVVKTVDANYAPIDPKLVEAWSSPERDGSFARKDVRPMTRTAKGTFTFGPVDALEFECFVEHPETIEIAQKLFFRPERKPEEWDFRGFPDFYSRNRTTHTRDGGGLTCELTLVVCSMRVADNDVNSLRQFFRKDRPSDFLHQSQPFAGDVRAFRPIILSGGGNGEDRLAFTMQKFGAGDLGKLRYIESRADPRLFACWDPVKKALARGNKPEDKRRPINYHFFLHPSTGHFGADPYPFGEKYLDLISRYVCIPGKTFVGHGLALQHRAGRHDNTIAVYPVGSATKMFNGLNTQASLLRAVQELHWVLQRADGDRFPQQPIGGVAISAFSSSIAYVSNILGNGIDGPMLSRNILREVYSFDGFHGRDNDAAVRSFCRALVRFVRANPAQRAFRAYSKNSVYAEELANALPGATVQSGPRGAVQFQHDAYTLLSTPLQFWEFLPISVANKTLDDHAHQTIPAYFMQHARSVSRLD